MDRYILMLENDPDDRYFTESTLTQLALKVNLRFTEYHAALPETLTQTEPPALIILSYNSYPEHILNMLVQIRSQPLLSHIPVVILTEELSANHVRRYYLAGANTVIKKPSSVEKTIHKIRSFFEYWGQVAELC